MALILSTAPESGVAIVRENVDVTDDQFIGLDQEGLSLEIAPPIPIYTSTSNGVFEGSLLDSAKLTAWQYVIAGDDSPRGLAELAARGDNQQSLSYASFYPPAYASWISDAIAVAESLTQAKENDYELRILRVPALYLRAVWLFRDDDSLLLPIEPAPANLEPGGVYREKQLAEALRPLAERRRNPTDR